MVSLELSNEEAEYLSDIIEMWCQGIEEEVKGLTNESDPEAHWSRYGLRKQFKAAGSIKMRLDLERGFPSE
jgi:hypothetical protein